jgi:hypothetical protein
MNPQLAAGVAQEDQDAAKLDAAERAEDMTIFGRHEAAEGAQPSCSASVS